MRLLHPQKVVILSVNWGGFYHEYKHLSPDQHTHPSFASLTSDRAVGLFPFVFAYGIYLCIEIKQS